MWQVFKNGKPLGIFESDYPWASQYWAERSINAQGDTYTLKKHW